MPYIRHESLFSLQDLYHMEREKRFDVIFATIDITPALSVINKRSRLGAPVDVNDSAMMYSLFERIIERIPTIKDLVKRLREDILFRLDCGFFLSESIPSEASYSRFIRKLSQSTAMEEMFQQVVMRAWEEGFMADDTIAIDATHIEARDQAPTKEEKVPSPPKKRGRKAKHERDAWLLEQQQEEEKKSIFEKKIADQLPVSYEMLRQQMPISPQWGVKHNSEGKHVYWYGYKGHFAVGTKSQYILEALLSSGSMNDGKAAIPLLKGIQTHVQGYSFNHATMDAGYDYEPIYQELRKRKVHAVIAYNRRREAKLEGFDVNFAPTCVREHSYRYDSYDPTYETLKYVRPKECESCPLANDSLCQKVFKMKITKDVRKYTAPARGSASWKDIAKRRSAVERVNAYLKEFFQLNNVRHRTGAKARWHFHLVTLVYNSMKLAVDRMNKQLKSQAS